jgi:hypothetical protein
LQISEKTQGFPTEVHEHGLKIQKLYQGILTFHAAYSLVEDKKDDKYYSAIVFTLRNICMNSVNE